MFETWDDLRVETWEDLKKKFPLYRDGMTLKEERAFVDECFKLYEKEGFAKVFWSQGGDYEEYHGKHFVVIGRVSEDEADIECLPMWKIRFENGYEINAYPDEINPREMIENGCKLPNIK